MNDLLPVLEACIAFAAVVIAGMSYRHTTSDTARKSSEKAIADAVGPVHDHALTLEKSLSHVSDRLSNIADRMTAVETKTEVFWRSVAIDVAKVLHSPVPERAHIDKLLEKLMAGKLNDADKRELETILVAIRDYEPGQKTAFPVYPGEQVAAVILLRAMEYS
jgi:hypothetical protein